MRLHVPLPARMLFSWSCAVVLGLASAVANAETVSVAVAANFTDATRDIVPLFEKATGHKVKVSYGSTGKLYAQISYGAPYEVFLAADAERPQKAVTEGLAVAGSRVTYAVGKLALWSPHKDKFDDGESFLIKGKFRRVAIANPMTAPYGLAARQVMERLGVWHEIQPKLVRGDSIAQTFQFVATENSDIGFVALSQLTHWQGSEGTTWEIPREYYHPISQQAVLLHNGRENIAAKAFIQFLKSAQAQAVISGYGYGIE